jgi:nucleotide-binding universal stress UspA family protein
MALKDLLVYVDRTNDALMRMRLAVDLAARHGSRVTALFVREWSEAQYGERRAAELGLISGAEIERMDHRIDDSIDQDADSLRAALGTLAIEHALSVDWRFAEGPASVAVAQHARYADLCIVGHYGPSDTDPNGYSFSERLLFTSGRPVLSVPTDRAFHSLGEHIAVAWNSSRASSRAVNDAMPLLELAEHVTVLTVNTEDFIGLHGALPARQLVEHLGRHRIEAKLVELEGVPVAAIAETLQSKSRSLGADLLVAGAFGHPRLWEKFMGGTTRSLLDHMNLPIMMSN